ncbi:MAG: hypothetical protein V1878_03450 [bacterium]
MKEVRMRKDSFWYGEYGENYKIRQAGLKIQAIDRKQRVLIIEAEKEEWL